MAALGRVDAPSLQEVADLAVQRQYTNSWHVYIAGLSERFRRTSALESLSDEPLRAMLAFDLTSPVVEGERLISLAHQLRSLSTRAKMSSCG